MFLAKKKKKKKKTHILKILTIFAESVPLKELKIYLRKYRLITIVNEQQNNYSVQIIILYK